MTTITLLPEHGYAAGVSILTALWVMSLSVRVGAARRAAGVPYPYVFAERSEAEKDKKKHLFNCAQRAHQNQLEFLPIYSTLFTIAAIEHPLIASITGLVYLFSRYLYTVGYCTGDPAKRTQGWPHIPAMLVLLVLSVKTAVSVSTGIKFF
eukprot:jgi/Hompol1/3519/HPOL_006582-RA